MNEEELRARLEEAEGMEPGETRTAQVRDVVRHAEASGHTGLLVEARLELLAALTFQAAEADFDTELAICQELPSTFVRCLALYDRAPEHFEDWAVDQLWWSMALVVMLMLELADRPTDRIRAVLDDMERRCGHRRNDLYLLYALRVEVEARAGNIPAADAATSRMRSLPRPENWRVSQEIVDRVRYLADLGRDEEAVEALQPLLTGEVPCTDQEGDPEDPQRHLVHLLLPYLRTGRLKEGAEVHALTWDSSQGEDDEEAAHLEFLARSGNEDRAWEILREDGLTSGVARTYGEMHYAAAAALVLRRIVELGRGAETIDIYPDQGDAAPRTMSAAEFLPESIEEAMHFARRAHACNGNTYQSDRVRALIHAEPLVNHLPLVSG